MENTITHTQNAEGFIARVTPLRTPLLPVSDRSHDPIAWPEYREHSLFEAAVREAARNLHVPRPMALMCAFGALATACQRLVDVEMPGSRSPIITSVMLLTVAGSGTGKSRTERYFFEAIREHEQRLQAEDQAAQQAYATALKSWQIKEKALAKLYEKAIRGGDAAAEEAAHKAVQAHQASQPAPPPSRRLLYDDNTAPGLLQALHASTPYACLLTSEAASFFNGQAVQSIDKFNTLWSGDPVTVDRVRQSFQLPKTRLTLALMTQPSVIEHFLKKRGEHARGTGFMARLLVAYPEALSASPPLTASEQPRRAAFEARVRECLEQATDQPQILRFSEAAVDFWTHCAADIQHLSQKYGIYEEHPDHAARLLENTARLAALLHAFERDSLDDQEISVETLHFCWRFVQACSQHFLRYLAGEPQRISDVNRLVEYLRSLPKKANEGAKGSQARFTKSDLQRYGPNCLRGAESQERLHDAINLLIRLGHIEGNHPGRSSPYYRFSEQCLTRSPSLRNGEQVWIKTLPLYESARDTRL